MLKLYAYQKCSTCRDAMKWLEQHAIPHEEIAIRDQPPTIRELEAALKARDGNLHSLFNSSGLDYRALGLKEKLPAMSQSEALKLLSQNGNLVKRPFAIDEGSMCFGGIQGSGVGYCALLISASRRRMLADWTTLKLRLF